MNKLDDVLKKTLGGLSKPYYFRHLFFAVLLASGYMFFQVSAEKPAPMYIMALMVINTLLYPYSRFVYESVVGFVMGQNLFIVNAFVLLLTKLFTMIACWAGAVFIAPLGLLYLYYHHSKPAS